MRAPLAQTRMIRHEYTCTFCNGVRGLLDNPYQYSGQVVAKLCVNIATALWAIVVLFKESALARWPGSFAPSGSANEDVLAALLLVACIAATWLLVRKDRPIGLGVCIYASFLALWLYTWSTLLVAIANGITAMRPGQIAGVTVVLLLAIFAFVSNPKRKRDGSPAD